MGIIEKVMGFCFTNTCPICGEVVEYGRDRVCIECKSQIKYVETPFCVKCGRPMQDDRKIVCKECDANKRNFDKGMCVFEHNDALRNSVYKFKYENKRWNAKYYGETAVEKYGRMLKQMGIELIVPIPIHSSRLRKRGYNQSEIFAKEISKRTGIPICSDALARRKSTMAQKTLTPNMRRMNLKNAFAINKNKLNGSTTILLVDDILTTGSTLDACSHLLKKVGVKRVYTLCISGGKGD